MAPPGSLEARYQRLTRGRQEELYIVRRRLGFTIDEWLDLPWWQRRVYVDGLRREAEDASRGAAATRGSATRQSGMTGLDAIYGGKLGEAQAAVRKM